MKMKFETDKKIEGKTYSVSRPGWPGSNDCVWPGVSNSLTTLIPRILNYCTLNNPLNLHQLGISYLA